MLPNGFFLLKFAKIPNALSIFQIVLQMCTSSIDLTSNALNIGGILNFLSTIYMYWKETRFVSWYSYVHLQLSCSFSTNIFLFSFLKLIFYPWIISKIWKGRESSIVNLRVANTQFQESSTYGQSCFISTPTSFLFSPTLNYYEGNSICSSHSTCKYFSMISELWFLQKVTLISLPHLKKMRLYFLHQISKSDFLFCLIWFL